LCFYTVRPFVNRAALVDTPPFESMRRYTTNRRQVAILVVALTVRLKADPTDQDLATGLKPAHYFFSDTSDQCPDQIFHSPPSRFHTLVNAACVLAPVFVSVSFCTAVKTATSP
jgi:hypothetical protein